MRLAINGFGRIGRCFLRILAERKLLGKEVEVVAVNDLGSLEASRYLFKYDTVHGRYNGSVEIQDNGLVIDGYHIRFLSEMDASKLPWKDYKVDVVVEATGVYTNTEKAKAHIDAGAKKVFITAPAKAPEGAKDLITIVYGVNHNMYDPQMHVFVSNASCTTNSLAPVVKVLHEGIGIERGFMTTIHAYTNDQLILDVAHKKEMRRSRAAAANIIPTTTGAAKAIGQVIPELKGKMDGLAVRVPVPCGSLTDLNVVLKRDVTKEEINSLLKKASENELKGVLYYTEDPIVSSDIVHTEYSSIVDGLSTFAIGNIAKVMAWYDNEWGFSCRLVDVCTKVLSNGL